MTLTRRSFLLISTGLAAMTAFGGLSAAFAQTETPTPETPAADTPAAPAEIQDFGIGDLSAKLQLHEYLSLTCPHCEHFHATLYPQLKTDYIDTGKLRLTLHEVYFDQYGLYGAMVARCGGELRYAGMIDMLFDKQRDWAGQSDVNVAVTELKKIGRAAGMNDDQTDACLRDQTVAEALVAHYQATLAKDFPNDSFSGTPSFILNGTVNTEISSNMAYDDLKKILDAELAK